MTAQLLRELRITLTRLAQEQKVSVSTCWRWTQRGIKGHKLASFSCGGRKFTTRESFLRWIAAINGERVATDGTPRQREREIQAAEKRAEDLGI